MITALVEADLTTPEGEVRKLDDLEVMGMLALISNAGNETVARMLGWAALVLEEYPDARREMAEDPSLLPGGVEELLRYEAPSPIQGRYVTRDVELHGTVLPEGATLALLTGSAGRDERKYPDPDTYDIHRSIDRHVTFGYGAHYLPRGRTGPHGGHGGARRGPAALPGLGGRPLRRHLRRHQHGARPLVRRR